jgi:ABC-type nitrate/sulfonate/bicarbonate transport system ATPase subunit
MTGSPLLLLDEPFANLDALTRITMQDWLKMITQKLGSPSSL